MIVSVDRTFHNVQDKLCQVVNIYSASNECMLKRIANELRKVQYPVLRPHLTPRAIEVED